MDLVRFITTVYDILSPTHGSITSWIRSRKHNSTVGGTPTSLHIYGLAVDCIFDEPTQALEAAIMFKRAGLYALDEGDHLHVQAYPPLPQSTH